MTDKPLWYILDEDGEPQPTWLVRTHPITGDVEVNHPFNQWMFGDSNNRVVMQTDVPIGGVSTVFTGLDQSCGRSETPILFETMIFPAEDEHPLQYWCYRYTTKAEAVLGHAIAVQLAEDTITSEDAADLLVRIPTPSGDTS